MPIARLETLEILKKAKLGKADTGGVATGGAVSVPDLKAGGGLLRPEQGSSASRLKQMKRRILPPAVRLGKSCSEIGKDAEFESKHPRGEGGKFSSMSYDAANNPAMTASHDAWDATDKAEKKGDIAHVEASNAHDRAAEAHDRAAEAGAEHHKHFGGNPTLAQGHREQAASHREQSKKHMDAWHAEVPRSGNIGLPNAENYKSGEFKKYIDDLKIYLNVGSLSNARMAEEKDRFSRKAAPPQDDWESRRGVKGKHPESEEYQDALRDEIHSFRRKLSESGESPEDDKIRSEMDKLKTKLVGTKKDYHWMYAAE